MTIKPTEGRVKLRAARVVLQTVFVVAGVVVFGCSSTPGNAPATAAEEVAVVEGGITTLAPRAPPAS